MRTLAHFAPRFLCEFGKLRQRASSLRQRFSSGRYRLTDSPPSAPETAKTNAHLTPPALPTAANATTAPARSQTATPSDSSGAITADIVICVHNAPSHVRNCLQSVTAHTAATVRFILVDDGSDPSCRDYLRHFAAEHARCTLLRNEQPRGYTKAANQGIRASSADYVVLLNSDTVVTAGWLEGLLECGQSDPRIGLVGPLSNAASWQSVPERFDGSGDWAVNPTPSGWSIGRMAQAVCELSERRFPRVPFLNGFCLAVKRKVIETIGDLDETSFPHGYGEENDYCLRASDAGFQLAVADHVYVFHAKSQSYRHERRQELSAAGRRVLARKHGRRRVRKCIKHLRDEPNLAETRRRLQLCLQDHGRSKWRDQQGGFEVLFILPVASGGGGAHSVVQEAAGMRELGVDAQVAVMARHEKQYRQDYPNIVDFEQIFLFYESKSELVEVAGTFDVVVGTAWSSMQLVRSVIEAHPRVLPAYYVQDYEPHFYWNFSPRRKAAADSYTLVPNAVLFAKTSWICDEVGRRHGVRVHKVSPSLDHDVYFPNVGVRTDADPVRVCAMVRPSTFRRGAWRTMRVLKTLQLAYGDQAEIHLFGAPDKTLAHYHVDRGFPFVNHGVLIRENVAELLRHVDVFIDLSDYQAFGRTGIEAMACGCAVLLPAEGGTTEYAIHGVNAMLVDTHDEDACRRALERIVLDRPLRSRLQSEAVLTAAQYSIRRAVISEVTLLQSELATRHQQGATPPLTCLRDVCVAVVTYNPDLEHLEKLLTVLSSATDRIVVVDNASGNRDALRRLLDRFDQITFVTNDCNRGVAHAVNQAIAIAGERACRYFIAFDQDSLPRDDALHRLRERHEQLREGRAVAAIGCRQIDTHSGERMPFFRFHGFRKETIDRPDDGSTALCETDFLITSGTMLALDAVAETGAMDEELFIDYVDTEWSFRARRAGYRLLGDFDAEMLHTIGDRRLRVPVIGKSFLAHDPSRQFYMTRNRLLLYRRSHLPLRWKIQDAARAAIKLACYVAFSSARRQYLKETFRGVQAASRGRRAA